MENHNSILKEPRRREIWNKIYRQVSNIRRRTVVGNKIVDHSDVVGASPLGPAPITSSFSTEHWIGQRQLQDETRNS